MSSSLINVMLHEKNKVNLVIPETQVIMMSEEERNALLKLYNRIDNEYAVSIDIESACRGRRSRVDSSSTLFIQLYLLSACALLNNCVEKIFFRMFWIICLRTENTENYGKVFRSPVMERFVCVMAVLVRNSIAR